jgi:hypothetical protein
MMQSQLILDACDSGQDADNPDGAASALPAPVAQSVDPFDVDLASDESGRGPFDWDYSNAVVIQSQPGVAVYVSGLNQIIIRGQSQFVGESDQFVVVNKSNLKALIDALTALLPDTAAAQHKKAAQS